VKILTGVLIMIVGVLVGIFLNTYLLITGVIDIIHGSNVFWGIVMIAFRGIIGFIVAIALWIIGFKFIKDGLK
jgi:hypothetical protein